jgi:hypothetical protein
MSKKIIVAAVMSLVATAALATEAAQQMPGAHGMQMQATQCACQANAPSGSHAMHMTGVRRDVQPAPRTSATAAPVASNIDLHPEDYR